MTNNLNSWQDELAKYALEAKVTEASSASAGGFISTRGGRLTYAGGEIPGNRMDVVILDAVLEYHLYGEHFNADHITSPICFAFGRSEAEMRPHPNSSQPQCDSCAACPKNQFGTAELGKGKACKNIRRLALIPVEGLEDLNKAEVAFLKIPVTSVKAYSGYIQQVTGSLKKPPFAVITEVSLVPDPKTQFRFQFKLVDELSEQELIKSLIEKRKQVVLDFPYAAAATDTPPPAPKKSWGVRNERY